MSIESHTDKQYKAVISVKQWQNQADKERNNLKRAKSIGELDKCAARAVRNEAIENKECFSVGFLEMCSNSAAFLKQVTRVAQTGMTISGRAVPAIKWGKQCCCILPMHKEDCWKVADKIYQFNSDHFFHLYVHQMLAEGVFNMHDHNEMNVTADFKKAAVNMKVFRSHHIGLISICPSKADVFVNTITTCMSICHDYGLGWCMSMSRCVLVNVQMNHNESDEVMNKGVGGLHEQMRKNQEEKAKVNKNISQRQGNVLNHFK